MASLGIFYAFSAFSRPIVIDDDDGASGVKPCRDMSDVTALGGSPTFYLGTASPQTAATSECAGPSPNTNVATCSIDIPEYLGTAFNMPRFLGGLWSGPQCSCPTSAIAPALLYLPRPCSRIAAA